MLSRRTFLIAATLPMVALPQDKKPMIVILLGPPGGGKGTQAEKITAEFGIPSISTGDLLRAEVKTGSTLGKQIQGVMQKGELVSDDIVNRLIADRISRADAKGGAILDGYPRTVAQARYLDRLLDERKLPRPVVVNLTVPDEEIITRLSKRGRKDDQPETIRERLKVYATETKPLIDYYRSGKFHEIDGLGTPEEVYQRVGAALR